MKIKLILLFVVLISVNSSVVAQKSNAEKMGYARTDKKYWGPGTFYCYAPGTPINKMANNKESAMRDLTGISNDDFLKELSKQGFVEVPKKEIQKWFNENNGKDKKFYYSSDKSYILQSGIHSLSRSPAAENGFSALVSSTVIRYVLIPKQDSLKVIEAVWQYFRDLNEMKVQLSSIGSNFKKAELKVYPIQRIGTSGWAGLRAGSFVLTMVDGKAKGYWESVYTVLRRTIGKPEFELRILAGETDFGYDLHLTLKKEGYVLIYTVLARNFQDLEPGDNWIKRYPINVEEYKAGVKGDKEAVNAYKKAPLPPVLEDLNKLLQMK